MRRRPFPSAKPARFFWQGLLILLPALVLAGAGFYSLREEEVLARHEAEEQAKQIATELAQRLIPQALRFEVPGIAEAGRLPATWEAEVLHRLRRSPLVETACLFDDEDALVYPPAAAGMPWPAPLDEAELSPAQQDGWLALETAWQLGEASAERDLATFLALEPPARFAAVARFRTAQALVALGQEPAAIGLLQSLGELPPEVVGESGVPLGRLAAWRLAVLLPENDRLGLLHDLAGRLVLEPSPAADAFLSKIVPLHPALHGWEETREVHESARKFAAATTSVPSGEVMVVEPRTLWPVIQPVVGGRWILGVPLDALAQEVVRLDRSMVRPAAFGVAVTAGTHPLLPLPADSPVLARSVCGAPPMTVEVFLKDPAAFAAQRRARTLRFATLIAMSAGAVVAGFFAAWRAFRRQQQLSEMKSNFVSSVSHELRAPIASVRLMAEELEHGAASSPEKTRQYLGFIGQECRRLSSVIENVLDFSRREQGRERFDFEPTDLAALVEETAALMRAYGSERGVRIEVIGRGQPEPVNADGRALQRLLVNLIDNALKHAPPDSAVRVGWEFAGSMVSLWVEDDGPGIPRQEQTRIFERFYRVGSELRRQTQGVGLGLSIVKHLAEVHGGRVVVRSEPGQGSRFTVELPLTRESMTAPSSLPSPLSS